MITLEPSRAVGSRRPTALTLSVIIVTLNRPDCLRQCLNCLSQQGNGVDEIVVVDASSDRESETIASSFANVCYQRTDVGYGHMTASRNLALNLVTSEIVAFIDDDAFAHEGWSQAICEPYSDPTVGGVGGRALNNQPGEELNGVDRIGRLYPDGRLTGFFAAKLGRITDVDHLIGCNMSWRRELLVKLGGLRDDYPGTEVREETDIALRVRKLGYRLLFQPDAVVTHVGAPQVKGRRFDTRYAYYASRNHAQLLLRNFGPSKGIAWRSGFREVGTAVAELAERLLAAGARFAARILGLSVGFAVGLKLWLRDGDNPIRSIGRTSPAKVIV